MHRIKKVKFWQTNMINFHQKKKKNIKKKKKKNIKKKKKKKKKKTTVNFYWDRNIAGKSIKAKDYEKNEFKKTREYLKFNFKHLEYSIGFRWVLFARYGYEFIRYSY